VRCEESAPSTAIRGGLVTLGAVIALALLTVSASAQQGVTAAAVQNEEKFLGNVWSRAQIQDFTRFWNQVTPENAGKWGPMEPRPGEFDWAGLDAAYALAKENGFPFRFHVLVWGNQQPAWVADLPVEAQMAAIRRRWSAIAERYPAIDYIEVVNEPLHDPPRRRNESDLASGNYIEALGGDGTTGWDWIVNAFRMAREYFPDAKLVLNEYGVTNSDEATASYLEIIRLLQAENLIDVVAVQAHSFSTTVDASVTKANLDRLAATGLPLMVTEMDIDGPSDEVQLSEYRRIFPTFWEHPSVIGITMWGWRPGMWRSRQGANLVREDGSHRPAFDWLLEYVGDER
jgi:endo-1,4-beta-xylanase